MLIYEIIGYTASVIIAISFVMSNVLRLRIVNSIGCFTFVVYGLIVHVYPVAAVNSFICVVNIWHIYKLTRGRDAFKLLELKHSDNAYLECFIEQYRDDIKSFFPGFDPAELNKFNAAFVLRNLLPVNLVLYNRKEDGVMDIALDYAVPKYRDFKNAHFLYDTYHSILKERGYHTLKVKATNEAFADFLSVKRGFKKSLDEPDYYIKNI